MMNPEIEKKMQEMANEHLADCGVTEISERANHGYSFGEGFRACHDLIMAEASKLFNFFDAILESESIQTTTDDDEKEYWLNSIEVKFNVESAEEFWAKFRGSDE